MPDDACLSCGVYNLGWMGDGEIYYVIGFQNEPADMLSYFNQGADSGFEKCLKNYLDKISKQSQTGIAEKNLPQWSAVYKYALCSDEKGNNLYAMYCPQTLNLYAVLSVNT